MRLERHAWPDPGMHEQIVADRHHQFEGLEERAVARGQSCDEDLPPDLGARSLACQRTDIDPIGPQGRLGTVGEPLAKTCGVLEEIEHDRLMIALEKMSVEAGRQRVKQELDDTGAVWPTVDVVADKD